MIWLVRRVCRIVGVRCVRVMTKRPCRLTIVRLAAERLRSMATRMTYLRCQAPALRWRFPNDNSR